MKRHYPRYLIIAFVTIGCVAWTIHLFDWPMVGAAIAKLRTGLFVGAGITLIGSIFALRGIRWLVVLGLPLDRRHFWQSFCANGAACGLATLTPFQLGEIVKLRMIPDHHGSAWRSGISGFFVERALDFAALIGIGGCGLALRFGLTFMSMASLLLPVGASVGLCMLSPLRRYLPERLQPYTQLLDHGSRIFGAGVLTMLLWLLYAALWWSAIRAIHVELNFSEVCMMLGGVTLAIIATMSPGGLGVAELGSRGILIWLGKSPAEADAAAIALRLLTPLLVGCGAACAAPLLLYRHLARLTSVTDAASTSDGNNL